MNNRYPKQTKRKNTNSVTNKNVVTVMDNKLFEDTFKSKLGRSPMRFIDEKIKSGSDIQSIGYYFNMIATDIKREHHIGGKDFKYYLDKYETIYGVKKSTTKVNIKYYNKLVRDKIPEIIKKSGADAEIKILDNNEYIDFLNEKLKEEVGEYLQSKSIEELADILEVMGAIVKAQGATWDELTTVRKKKKEKNGGFDKRYLLVSVMEKVGGK